jgi:hypothetical protein
MFLCLVCVVWHVDCTACAVKTRRFLNLDLTHRGNRLLWPLVGSWVTLRVAIEQVVKKFVWLSISYIPSSFVVRDELRTALSGTLLLVQ